MQHEADIAFVQMYNTYVMAVFCLCTVYIPHAGPSATQACGELDQIIGALTFACSDSNDSCSDSVNQDWVTKHQKSHFLSFLQRDKTEALFISCFDEYYMHLPKFKGSLQQLSIALP